jgi:cyclophilin family peptidyl-prolyl cis-trans isomerase/HEAT repeat protein
MIKQTFLLLVAFLTFLGAYSAQVPLNVGIQILKAEDARRYDATLENLMRSPNADFRKRAALAAGRIGKEDAIPALVRLLESDTNNDVRTIAAFALGETESIKAAEAVLSGITAASTLRSETRPSGSVPRGRDKGTLVDTRVSARMDNLLLARLVEAAGKISAANPKDERSKKLGEAVLNVLKTEREKMTMDTEVLRLGLTAVLRARPAGADETVRKFLSYTDPNVVADALNTLARLRSKNANRDARDLLATNPNAVVRANAARVLGAAEDKEAVDVLIKAATSDPDERVRVSAIRSLAALRDAKAVEPLTARAQVLLDTIKRSTRSRRFASEQNEFLEIVTAFGRLLPNTQNEKVLNQFREFVTLGYAYSPEVYVALMRMAAGRRNTSGADVRNIDVSSWKLVSASMAGMGELARIEPTSDEGKKAKAEIPTMLLQIANEAAVALPTESRTKAAPDILRAFAAYKTDDLEAVLRTALNSQDVWVRATAAELLAENAPSTAVRLQIENAFKKALTTDKHDNDAQLAMLDAMAKINKTASLDTLYIALNATDYLVRKRAFEILDDPEIIQRYPGARIVLETAKAIRRNEVLPYDPKTGTKLGQVLNTDADYRRALSRKNGRTKAIVTTEKGTFTIDLLPEDAPLTVDNLVKLARSNYFNGLEVHRVVPNFVMQDGDPRGDGNGGPGWSIRCEINMVPYERGAVGMALSGKDTGGSQWFVTHSPQPHLDGGYTVFGKVNETGMKVVDRIVRGDKILSIRIIENALTQRPRRSQRR